MNPTRFHRWFEVNKLGCVVSPGGGAAGYVFSGFNSVEEVVHLKGNKSRGGKNNNCGGHPQEENREGSMRNYFLIWEYLGYNLGISGI